MLSAKAQLQSRFGASVAEVDHHELWQRATLTAAFVAREARGAEELAAAAERWLAGLEWELVRADVTLVSWASSRAKRFRLGGLDPDAADAAIERLLAGPGTGGQRRSGRH